MIKNSSRIVLNAFLANCKANERVALFQYLSPIERQVIEKLPKTYGNPLADNETEASLLRHIHPSWIAPFLRTLPEKEIGFFLASLEHSRGHAVGKELLYTSPLPKLTALGKAFLQKTLLQLFLTTQSIEEDGDYYECATWKNFSKTLKQFRLFMEKELTGIWKYWIWL